MQIPEDLRGNDESLLRISSFVGRARPAEAVKVASERLSRLLAVSAPEVTLTVRWAATSRGAMRMEWRSRGLGLGDLRWALEPVAVVGNGRALPLAPRGLAVFSVEADPGTPAPRSAPIGFSASPASTESVPTAAGTRSAGGEWLPPSVVPADDLLGAFRDSRAWLVMVAAPAEPESRPQLVERLALAGAGSVEEIKAYVGSPHRAALLIGVPGGHLGARLQAAVSQAVPHARFRRLGTLGDPEVQAAWLSPGEFATPLPGAVAQALFLIPAVHSSTVVPGVAITEPAAAERPMRRGNARGATLTLGRAGGLATGSRPVALAVADARRHTQVVGQTGAGKSTALVTLALSAASTGHGLTLLDPHGSTARRLLTLLPDEALARTVLVQVADTEHPVRASLWPSLHPASVEKAIAELNALFREILDPGNAGMVGARFERWFTLHAKANIALLGRRASLDTIATLAASVETTRKLARAVKEVDPETSRALADEYGRLGEREFADVLSWAASKVQRFTSVAALRETFGAGVDALAFPDRLHARDIVLIDLGMPTLGAAPSAIAGTLFLQHLWRAVTSRGVTEASGDTHFVLVDEAQRFQHGALPQMLAEGRKFGLAVTVAHQHASQLAPEVRDALDANAGSLLAFRSSPRDASPLAVRLGADVAADLPRLGNLTALASLCVEGSPAPPFSLTFRHPRPVRAEEEGARVATELTRRRLVEPFADESPLAGGEALALLTEACDRIAAAENEERNALLQAFRRTSPTRLEALLADGDEPDDDFDVEPAAS